MRPPNFPPPLPPPLPADESRGNLFFHPDPQAKRIADKIEADLDYKRRSRILRNVLVTVIAGPWFIFLGWLVAVMIMAK